MYVCMATCMNIQTMQGEITYECVCVCVCVCVYLGHFYLEVWNCFEQVSRQSKTPKVILSQAVHVCNGVEAVVRACVCVCMHICMYVCVYIYI